MRINFKVIILALVLFAGCKKYDNPPPVFQELKIEKKQTRNILIVSIDGLGGDVVKAMAPPTITSLLPNSKYTYSMFKSAVASDAASWTSMLTGASYPKHLVSTDDFQVAASESNHSGVVTRNNVLDLVGIYKATPTAVITPWPNLRQYLVSASISPEVTSDLATKDSTVAVLKRTERLGAVVVNFRDALTTGTSGGFTDANAAYKTAVVNADTYLKEIMDAVKARKNYANEDWLVIVTSNHGGSNANPTSGFMLVYNPRLKGLEFKNFGFSTVLFAGNSIAAAVSNDNGLYNAANDKDFTVQAQIKVSKASTGYVTFFSKGNGYPNAPTVRTGWAWGTWTNQWRIYHTSGFNSTDQGNISDGTWHTLTTTVKRVNATTRTAQNYFDGVPCASPINWGTTNLTTTEPLRIGFRPGSSGTALEFYMANLAYFQTALDATVIKNTLSLKDITQHPNYNSLIGYWKMDEGAESIFQNYAPGGYNMTLSGPFQWAALGADAPTQSTFTPVEPGTSFRVTSADVGALAIYWMGLKGDADLDGNPFLKNYEIEFLK